MRQQPEQIWSLWDSPPEPPHQTRDTSVAAYVEHVESGKMSLQQSVLIECLRFFKEHPLYRHGMTRGELSLNTTIRLSSVCARVNELLKKSVLKDERTRHCSVTGRAAHVIELV